MVGHVTSCSGPIGQVNPAFISYQDREGAARVFTALGDPGPIFEVFAGDAPYSITFSEADDQEFTHEKFEKFLKTPGNVAFVNLAVVSDREKHLQLREKLFAKMANSPNVVDFYKFNIWREQPQGFDNSAVELLLYTARSRADLASFVQVELQTKVKRRFAKISQSQRRPHEIGTPMHRS